ncbi:hypothetical protein Kisp01_65830 [Kineosporia sp. NBRC 101677]|uniref:LysM peptidoglycan-binding domain-containing protein n=1 Tax=Kineosporia sp. NBRC 101677 TaxID=3032197 RepID=UPI0024A3907B|nr:LysM peptidoglycan-binding domain-containing protein [Kineosporia sp. NBRC 101677]GLY19569.1 hypothetical protein Kisp01_65830 [Kineosporia sp. NBRC 101677]
MSQTENPAQPSMESAERPYLPGGLYARALGAAAVLLGIVAGIPAALLGFGAGPLHTLTYAQEAVEAGRYAWVLLAAPSLLLWAWWVWALLSIVREFRTQRQALANNHLWTTRGSGLLSDRQGRGAGHGSWWVRALVTTVVLAPIAAPATALAAPVPATASSAELTAGLPTAVGPTLVAGPADNASSPSAGKGEAAARPARTDPHAQEAELKAVQDAVQVPASAEAATRAVTVQSWGQDSTLWGLAETHLGDGARWGEIWSLNEGHRQQDGTVMRSPSFLRPGWTVLVPETHHHPSNGTQAAQQAPATGGSYTIATGDRLADIASRYLGDPEQYTRLQDLNRRTIPDADHIETGDQIRLPSQVRDRGSRPHARGTSTPAQRSDTTPASGELAQDAPNGHRVPDDATTTMPQPAPSAEVTGKPTRPNSPTPQPTSPDSSSHETTHASPTASTNSGSTGSLAEHWVDTPAGIGPLLGDVWQWALGLGGAVMAVLLLRRRKLRPDEYFPERMDSEHRRNTDRDGLELAGTDDEESWDDTDREDGPRLRPETAAVVRRPAIDQARAAIHQMAQNVPAAAPARSATHEPSETPRPEVVQVQTNSVETEQGGVAPPRRVYVVKNDSARPRNGAVPRISPKPTAVRSADSIPPLANPVHLNAHPTAPPPDPGTLPLINGHQQNTQLDDKPRSQPDPQEQAERRPRRPRHRAEPARTTSESEAAPKPLAQPSPAQPPPPDPTRPQSDQPHTTPDLAPKTNAPQTNAGPADRGAAAAPVADWETKPPKNHSAAASSNVHIRLFGAPAILDSNGTPVPNLRRQALALLLYLALHPEGASTSTLQEVLWPDATLTSAKKRFSTEISNLRRVIRAAAGTDDLSYDAVPADRGHYRLRPDLDIDLWTFTRALARAESDPEHREQHLRRAIAAQSGHLADDGTRYPWLAPHRTHLSRQRAKAKRALAALIQDENPEEAAALITQADQAEASLGPPRQPRPDQANSHRSPESPR